MYPTMAAAGASPIALAAGGWDAVFVALWGLHVLAVVAFFTGVLFLVILALKTFTPAQLKSWAIGLMIVGAIVCLLTIGMIGRPWVGLMGYGNAGMYGVRMQNVDRMMDTMMENVQEHDAGKNDPAHMRMQQMIQRLRQQ